MTNEQHRAPRVTAVMRFSWNARERAYTANHGQHSYAVRPVMGGGWNLYVDGIARQGAGSYKPLLKAAQDRARAEQERRSTDDPVGAG